MATFYDSKNAKFTVATNDTSATIISIEGLPGVRELNDVTAFGSDGHRWGAGLEHSVFTITGMYDITATVGSDTLFGPARTATSVTAFTYQPYYTSTAVARTEYGGNFWVENYEVIAKVGNIVTFKATCRVDNGVGRTTPSS